MLTYEDCVGLCKLTLEEIAAIAEHEHVPDIVALEFGHYLIETEDGVPAIKRIIVDDIDDALARGDEARAARLRLVLCRFVEGHPENPSFSAAAAVA